MQLLKTEGTPGIKINAVVQLRLERKLYLWLPGSLDIYKEGMTGLSKRHLLATKKVWCLVFLHMPVSLLFLLTLACYSLNSLLPSVRLSFHSSNQQTPSP